MSRFASLPQALQRRSSWHRLGTAGIPAMIVRPERDTGGPAPAVIWMHGRTVSKELDPGRYLRWMRAGIAACAVDLPGHGERHDPDLQSADLALDVVTTMLEEIDPVVEALRERGDFDMERLGIGGVSAGGMAAMARLCRDHPFRCASVEAATGSWRHQSHRAMFRGRHEEATKLDPIAHLDAWREIPFQAIHSRADEWVAAEGQAAFIEALRGRYRDAALIDFVLYDRTGATYEHAGFGRMAADAKGRQTAFFRQHLNAAG